MIDLLILENPVVDVMACELCVSVVVFDGVGLRHRSTFAGARFEAISPERLLVSTLNISALNVIVQVFNDPFAA